MKKIFLITAIALIILSCKENKTAAEKIPPPPPPTKEYPAAMASVFKAHGGIANWNAMNNLCFTMEKEGGDETHTIDLKSRKVKIETPKYTIGYDGKKVWTAQDSTHFPPQRARFYHNLMFYFYAMPFVLGDDGISYSETTPLEFEGTSYPGTKISFGAGVGDAPDDEYIIYHDPKTNQMAWLAYTVTYGKNEKSDRFSYIKYNEWQEVNGLQLPSKLQWYAVEDGIPIEMRNERSFVKPTATETKLDPTLFEKPEKGTFAE